MNPSFQGKNKVFVLLFENTEHKRRHPGYFLPEVNIKGCYD